MHELFVIYSQKSFILRIMYLSLNCKLNWVVRKCKNIFLGNGQKKNKTPHYCPPPQKQTLEISNSKSKVNKMKHNCWQICLHWVQPFCFALQLTKNNLRSYIHKLQKKKSSNFVFENDPKLKLWYYSVPTKYN